MTENNDEQWLPVPDYVGFYEVSNCGRVRSVDRVVHCRNGVSRRYSGRVLRPAFVRRDKRYVVKLSLVGDQTPVPIARLVALAFIGPRPPKAVVRHLNDIATDDRPENLAYGTQAENRDDCVRNGNHHYKEATHCLRGHAFEGSNLRTKTRPNNYEVRECVACKRGRDRARTHPEGSVQEFADAYYAELMASA